MKRKIREEESGRAVERIPGGNFSLSFIINFLSRGVSGINSGLRVLCVYFAFSTQFFSSV